MDSTIAHLIKVRTPFSNNLTAVLIALYLDLGLFLAPNDAALRLRNTELPLKCCFCLMLVYMFCSTFYIKMDLFKRLRPETQNSGRYGGISLLCT